MTAGWVGAASASARPRLGVARVLVLRGSRVLVQLRLDLGERGPGRDLLLDGLVRVRARARVQVRVGVRVRVRDRVRVGVGVRPRVRVRVSVRAR